MRKGLAIAILCLGLVGQASAAGTRHAGNLAAYNGAWMISVEGACTGIGSGQVTILNGRVIALNMAGRVSAGGAVHTISSVNGITTVSDGLISGTTAAGSYRQSNGCTGAWTGVKL